MTPMSRIDCTHDDRVPTLISFVAMAANGRRAEVMYVIAGVSGNTGSVAANTLLSEGYAVRVLVRDPAKGDPWKAKGAEVAVADLYGDEGALARAFSGAKGVYVLLPPLMRDDF